MIHGLTFWLAVHTQLAIDWFITDASSDVQHMDLVNALDILSARLKHEGLLIIVDIEKIYGYTNSVDETLMDGKKEEGNGSREVLAALEDVGMEDIAVIEDQNFRVEVELFGQKRAIHEKYFMVRARKGDEDGDQPDETMASVVSAQQERLSPSLQSLL